MRSKNHFDILKEATLLLLNCGEESGLMKQAVDQMYDVFTSFSAVDTSNQNDDEIILDSGKAISPAEAAQCLFDFKRTAKFVRGLNGAIQKKRKEEIAPIQVLYAGCGPYATLVTPMLTLYSESEICIDLLDINEVSLNSARQTITGLGLENSIGDLLLEDATLFKVKKDYDIIVSETMQAALRSEPQVAIMQNLYSQIRTETIFLPEEIIVEAKLNTLGTWNPDKLRIENEERIDIGEVLKVNRQTIKDVLKTAKFNLLHCSSGLFELKFYTTIKIFKNEYLTEGDSGLASPVKILDFNNADNCELEFSYNHNYPAEINLKIKEFTI